MTTFLKIFNNWEIVGRASLRKEIKQQHFPHLYEICVTIHLWNYCLLTFNKNFWEKKNLNAQIQSWIIWNFHLRVRVQSFQT